MDRKKNSANLMPPILPIPFKTVQIFISEWNRKNIYKGRAVQRAITIFLFGLDVSKLFSRQVFRLIFRKAELLCTMQQPSWVLLEVGDTQCY